MKKEKVNPVTAVSTENIHDEGDIISDQDVTTNQDLTSLRKNPGADGSDNPSLSERDVKDQMDHATRVMDYATGRSRNTKRRRIP